MSAASSSANLRHVPSEILEEIPVNLPIKSLIRFSTVSKSWRRMISESRFVQKHKRRAAVNGVNRMVTVPLHDDLIRCATSVSRIPLASSTVIDDSTHLIFPIEGDQHHLRASCDGLWFVEAENIVQAENSRFDRIKKISPLPASTPLFRWHALRKSDLYLWNHSTRTHRKLTDSSLSTTTTFAYGFPNTGLPNTFAYGFGYDSAADDYKIFKIARLRSSTIETELYSLKSDSWKTISAPPAGVLQESCEYVNGSFHWIPAFRNTIVSFNLSTEKCGEVAFPATALDYDYDKIDVEVVVARGKLCVSVNKKKFSRPIKRFCFVLWAMEEYGVEKSWTKMLNIEYGFPRFYYPNGSLRPLYFYDNGDILLTASQDGLCMYKNKGARFQRIVVGDESRIYGGFIYVETLVSPLPEWHQQNNESSRVKT